MSTDTDKNTRFLKDCLALASQHDTWLSSQKAALHNITTLIFHHFGVEQVSFWQLDHRLNSLRLLVGVGSATLSNNLVIKNISNIHHLDIEKNENIANNHQSGITAVLYNHYLAPNKINSALYAGIQHQNQTIAILCIESQPARYWSSQESQWIGYLANLLSPIIISHHQQNQSKGLDGVIKSLPIAIVRAPMDLGIPFEYISEGVINLCGYSAEELIAESPYSWRDLVFKEDIHVENTIYHDHQELLINVPQTVEYRIRHKDGCHRWIRSISNFYTNLLQNGQCVLHAILIDITNQKNQEAKEQQHLSLVKQQNAHLRVFNLLAKILSKSSSLKELFIHFAQEATFRTNHQAVYPLGDPKVFANKNQSWDTWQQWTIAQKIHQFGEQYYKNNDFMYFSLDEALLSRIVNGQEMAELKERGLLRCQFMPVAYEQHLYGIFQIWPKPDYIMTDANKSFRDAFGQLLGRGVTHFLNSDRLEYMANYDALTHLKNRSYARTYLEKCIAHQVSFALLIVDLNGFKEINDSLGHEIGDKLLIKVAENLDRLCSDDNRNAFRLGGDEFALIIETESTLDIEIFSQLVSRNISQSFEVDVDFSVRISGSIGISQYPKDAKTDSEIMRYADIAMYKAKENGEAFQFYKVDENIARLRRLQLMSELPTAIASNQLQLYYQPIIDLKTGNIKGLEGLVRWHHPVFSTLVPSDFLSFVETSSHFNNLTLRLLEDAIDLQQRLSAQGHQLQFSINISPSYFENHQAFQLLLAQVKRYHLQPEQLCFEITETLLIKDVKRISGYLKQLSDAGVSLAIDDFGVGFSSFSYLKTLPIDVIKIDQSFIVDMLNNQQSRIIVETAINMAKQLGLQTTAEGIENQETYDLLQSLGANHGQGFLITEALTAKELSAWLKRPTGH